MFARRILPLAVTTLVLIPVAGPAQVDRSIQVQPTLEEPLELADRSYSRTITYTNHDTTVKTVTLALRELWQTLDGAPSPRSSAKLTGAFRLSATRLNIPGGQKRTVQLTGSIPASDRSSYPVIVATLPPNQGSTVPFNFRILSQFLLRGPRPWNERIAVSGVSFWRDAEGKINGLYIDVKNIGNVHVRPTGTAEIRSGATVLKRVALENLGRILPTCNGGCRRRLRAPWVPPANFNGPIDVTIGLRGPNATFRTTLNIENGGTVLPTAAIAFTSATPSNIAVRVTNTGTVPLDRPALQLTAVQDEKFSRAQETFTLATLKPKGTADKDWRPVLPDGRYVITGKVLLGLQVLAESSTTLEIGDVAPSRPFALLGVAVALLAVVGLLFFFLWKRRRNDKDEDDPARKPAAAARR